MYQALYRKWRSRTFSEMVGQEAILRTLRNQVASGRVAHAYLFSGSRGTGKTSAAKIMARAINCLNPVDGDPCLVCDSCRMLANETSLDIYEMDAASNSRVEEIRDLLERVDYPPQFGRYKVYIIDEAHMLSGAAFNALLKTLEEPPPYMVFILATTEPQKLPATILSRCQRFDFGRLTEEQIISRIKGVLPEMETAEPAALQLIARSAEGSMRDAWSLLDMCLGADERLTEQAVREALGTADGEFMHNFTAALASGDGRQALELVDKLLRDGRDVLVFLRDYAAFARRLAACKLGAATEAAGDERLTALAGGMSMARLLRVIELAMLAETDAKFAASPRAVLELFALKACRMSDSMGEGGEGRDALLDRVEELETALSLLIKRGVAPQPDANQGSQPGVMDNMGTKQTNSDSNPGDSAAEQSGQDADARTPTAKSQTKAAPTAAVRKPQDVWNAALKRLSKADMSLYAMVNQGRFGGFSEGVYRLRFAKDGGFFQDFVNVPERHEALERLLTEEGGAPARFEAVLEGDKAPGLATAQRRDESMLIEALGRDKVVLDD